MILAKVYVEGETLQKIANFLLTNETFLYA